MNTNWYKKDIKVILTELNTREHGLFADEVKDRLHKFGPNKLPESKADSVLIIFLRQFKSPLIYILFGAAVVVLSIGEMVDGAIIFAVLFFNAVVGAIQEGRAQNALYALKNFTETKATVFRNGKESIISGTQVVPGDILILQEGEKIPADARIIKSNSLKVDEAVLTGESEPVDKIEEIIEQDNLETAEQRNMVFKGTNIVGGNGLAVITATGINTVIGKIAKDIMQIDTEIPLKANIRHLSHLILATVAFISISIFFLGISLGKSPIEMFLTVVTLVVSIIPEGLPIVLTLILATGVWRMSKRNALVKKLQAVEALGQVDIIAVDKTGTITKNELMVSKAYVDGNLFDISGEGYNPKGDFSLQDQIIDPLNHSELLSLGKLASLSAGARVMYSEDNQEWQIAGEPTEAAMLVFSQKLGFHKEDLEREFALESEITFDYRLKYRAAIYSDKDNRLLTVSGAPEIILGLSDRIWRGGKSFEIDKDGKEELEKIFLKMTGAGLRVIALAENNKPPKELNPETVTGLTFVGFVGLKDTLRSEVDEAVAGAKLAGIKVVMITGDHADTAKVIAFDAGIFKKGDMVITGKDIDNFSDSFLFDNLDKVSVFARVTPEHKMKIVQAYKARGRVIAMTGDGVNDAPPLVAADLGVAMGRIGTEVAKEASDMILLDDNFSSIMAAVEEGRDIYKTIKKVMLYLFSTSLGEVFVITGALILSFPLPLLPTQIIWLNFVTDGFLNVALAMEQKEKGLLKGRFLRPSKYIVDQLMAKRIFLMAMTMAIGSLYLFKFYYPNDLTKAMTISLTVMAVFQWFNAWNCRSEEKSLMQMNLWENKFLLSATGIVILLQVLAVYTPFLQNILYTTELALIDWLVVLSIGLSIIIVEEVRKIFYRSKIAKEKTELVGDTGLEPVTLRM